MPKRKLVSQVEQTTSPPVQKRSRSKVGSPVQQSSHTNSDESHRTEQLLHRHSVTPPQKQPQRRQSQKRDSFSSATSACTTSPGLGCLGSANSDAESDTLQYSSDTALYYPGTDLVIDGWFQPCRGCGAFTAGQLEAGSKVAPLCHRCQQKLTQAVEGVLPHTCNSGQEGPVDYFYGWMSIRVPVARQQSLPDRLQVRHDLLVKMSDHWIRCREEARAANCRVPCA